MKKEKTLGEKISEFFLLRTEVYNKKHGLEHQIENVDNECIYASSPNNFIFIIKSILNLLEPFNPTSLISDDSENLDFGEIIYYHDRNNKGRSIYVRLPLGFCKGADMTIFNKWRKDKKNNEKSTKYI